MHRRPLGRGRTLAVIAAAIMLAALPPAVVRDGRRLRPSGDRAAVLRRHRHPRLRGRARYVLALVTLPYAVGDPAARIDAWPAYLLLFVLGVAGVALWPIDLLGVFPAGLLPDRAPGFWIAILGVIVLGRAVFDDRSRGAPASLTGQRARPGQRA